MNVLFPYLNEYINMPWDADFKFNIESIRNKMSSFVDERLKNPKCNEQFDDILQFLLKDEYYAKNTVEI